MNMNLQRRVSLFLLLVRSDSLGHIKAAGEYEPFYFHSLEYLMMTHHLCLKLFVFLSSHLPDRFKSIMNVARAKLDLIKPEDINMDEYKVRSTHFYLPEHACFTLFVTCSIALHIKVFTMTFLFIYQHMGWVKSYRTPFFSKKWENCICIMQQEWEDLSFRPCPEPGQHLESCITGSRASFSKNWKWWVVTAPAAQTSWERRMERGWELLYCGWLDDGC